MHNELRASDERSKKAMADCLRMTEELRAEQEHSNQSEKLRKRMESQIKELQARLDESEANALKGGKKIISKLEQRVK